MVVVVIVATAAVVFPFFIAGGELVNFFVNGVVERMVSRLIKISMAKSTLPSSSAFCAKRFKISTRSGSKVP